jgi:lipid II:glycine glycyltransferase (peptidoglycan interpeptide bridge formation enzyme)
MNTLLRASKPNAKSNVAKANAKGVEIAGTDSGAT